MSASNHLIDPVVTPWLQKRQYLLPYRPTKQQLDGAAEIIAVEEDAAPFSRSEIVECIEYAPEFQVGERYVVFDCELVGDEWYVGIVGKFDSKPETQASRFKRLQATTQGLTPQQFIDRHSHAQNLFEDAADSMGQIADIFEVNGFEVTAVQQAIAELYEAKTHVVAVAPQK